MPQQLVAVVELEDELSTVETALQRLVRRAKAGLRRWCVRSRSSSSKSTKQTVAEVSREAELRLVVCWVQTVCCLRNSASRYPAVTDDGGRPRRQTKRPASPLDQAVTQVLSLCCNSAASWRSASWRRLSQSNALIESLGSLYYVKDFRKRDQITTGMRT